MRDTEFEHSRVRALTLSGILEKRDDIRVRSIIEDFNQALEFRREKFNEWGITEAAWSRIHQLNIEPKLVFAHPDLLYEHPETSLYYRGMAMLPLKRVSNLVTNVEKWERDSSLSRTARDRDIVTLVSKLYNSVISSIISSKESWSLEDGHRNIVATIGISLDGKIRNLIGQEAEEAIKSRLLDWIENRMNVVREGNYFLLGEQRSVRMSFGSEPDIWFEKSNENSDDWKVVLTVEIKAGTDPAGAMERLGAIKKSFDKTPARADNIAILGVVTETMRSELNEMKIADYLLAEVLTDEGWNRLADDLFHHKLRLL